MLDGFTAHAGAILGIGALVHEIDCFIRDALAEMRGLTMDVVETEAPVRITGTLDGVPFYLPARWHQWELGADDDPVAVVCEEGARAGICCTGQHDPARGDLGASHMDLRVAEDIIRRCAQDFRRARSVPA